MTLPIERKYTIGAYALMIIFFIIAAISIAMSLIAYDYRRGLGYNQYEILVFLFGLVCIIIACIPFMYNSPAIPIIVKNGNNVTVTNYNSLGSNPTLKIFRIINNRVDDVYSTNLTFDATVGSWYSPNGFDGQEIVVCNYRGGLVYSQSASV